MTMKIKRRLTTILCSDVEGYARLMETDEAGTLTMLRRCRATMAKLIERHEGRIVNTWGDAIIAEFASVVEAVQCAVETQQELSGDNGALPDAQRMKFRIGINLGDVMVEGDDVYGDGVNVAARLQELAEPGGILISGPVYDQVRNKLSIGFENLGNQSMKNIAHPVVSYRVTRGEAMPRSGSPSPDPKPAPTAPRRTEGRTQSSLASVWSWYIGLPRPIAVIAAIAGFLFLINVFSGLDNVWFHWPVAPLILVVVLWSVSRHKSQ